MLSFFSVNFSCQENLNIVTHDTSTSFVVMVCNGAQKQINVEGNNVGYIF